MLELNEEQVVALQRLCDYLFHAEKEDFEALKEDGEDVEGHIFNDIKTLYAALDGEIENG